ncbi:MAG: GrpB family protein, partial [Acidobacteriota bacterium]|nr:GrpB family protein [Acidobacteriota bacterium]
HFGSTSIPNLPAKPIIDVLVLVKSVADARHDAVPALESLGYAFWYDNPDPAHLFFVKGLPPNGPRTHHVHIVEADYPDAKLPGFRFADRLRFRDALRADPHEAARYADLKRRLASQFPDDREAYTDGKGDYVREVMARAKPD